MMIAPPTAKIIDFPGQPRSSAPARPSLTPVLDVMPPVEARLEELAAIAPESPVSLLFVRTVLEDSFEFERLGIMLWRYLRPTDTLHRAGDNAWAIVLQGATARTAGALAARIEFELSRRVGVPAIDVGVATGRAQHRTTLVAAAALSFPEVS